MQVSPFVFTFSLLWFSMSWEELCFASKIRRRHLVKENEILSRYPGQDDYISPTVTAVAVEGGDAMLPCDLQSSIIDDAAALVLWYRNDVAKPIYSYDVRSGASQHWTNSAHLGSRAHFDPARGALVIKEISSTDADIYKCRVDFKVHTTLSYSVNLTVIIPPHRLWINSAGDLEEAISVVGPYEEGENLQLRCKSVGGSPSPQVSWWDGFNLIDDQMEIISEQNVVNILVIEKLQRIDLNRKLTCKANNTHLISSLETTVTVDMNFAPTEVKILSAKEPLSAGRRYEISCHSQGSKPSAQIQWSIKSKNLKKFEAKTTVDGSITRSILHFVPEEDDNDLDLQCIATVSPLPDVIMIDTWRLMVYFPPKVSIQLASFLDLNNIEEANDIYFECIIHANPRAYRVVWYHQESELKHDMTRGVIMSNQSLVLQNLTRSSSGLYSCKASNIEGDGVAAPLQLAVKYAPVCKEKQTIFFGVAPNEEIKIPCSVESYPKPNSFTWTFNNSGESSRIPKNQISDAIYQSTVSYIPKAEIDYGTLLCSASNSVGKQKQPCLFHVFPAGRPDPLTNCSQFNLSDSSVNIRCHPGFDGGLTQHFILEVYDSRTKKIVKNITQNHSLFSVSPLPSANLFEVYVYSANSKGVGEKNVLNAYTLKDNAEKRTAAIKPAPSSKQDILNSILVPVLVLGILIGLLLTSFVILSIFKAKRRRKRNLQVKLNEPHQKIANQETHKTSQEDSSTRMIDASDPDIIPNKGVNSQTRDDRLGVSAIFTSHGSSLSQPLLMKSFKELLIDSEHGFNKANFSHQSLIHDSAGPATKDRSSEYFVKSDCVATDLTLPQIHAQRSSLDPLFIENTRESSV